MVVVVVVVVVEGVVGGGGGFEVGKRLERCSFGAAGEACKAISSSSLQALKREHFDNRGSLQRNLAS